MNACGRCMLSWLVGACLSVFASMAASASPPQSVAPMLNDTGLAPTWRHGPFMEIYVRGFQDSNGDGIGDLPGLISRLDYLQELGITGIWLMPIFVSQDQDHGYAVSNYRDIEPDYGTMADFERLLAEAHRRGIGVILDYLPNHSAADHPYFESARSDVNSPYRDWYVWRDDAPTGWNIYGSDPWHKDKTGYYFGGFWDQMPDWNWRNERVAAYHQDNLRFWLNKGVDGFRFDAVGNLIENGPLAWESQSQSHDIMHILAGLVMTYPNRYVVCEAPGDPLGFAQPNSCGSGFAFGHNNRVVSAALGNPAALEQVASYFVDAPANVSGFTSNHDRFTGQRLWDRMRGKTERYKLAAALYLLQNAAPPFIYYGEEIGMSGAKRLGGDHKLRTPMSWSATNVGDEGFTTTEPFRAYSDNMATQNVANEKASPESLLHFYRDVIALRRQTPALLHGDYGQAQVDGWQMAFRRQSPQQTAWVVFNMHNDAARWTFRGMPAGAKLRLAWPKEGKSVAVDHAGNVSLEMPGLSFWVLTKDEQP